MLTMQSMGTVCLVHGMRACHLPGLLSEGVDASRSPGRVDLLKWPDHPR